MSKYEIFWGSILILLIGLAVVFLEPAIKFGFRVLYLGMKYPWEALSTTLLILVVFGLYEILKKIIK